MISLNEGLMIDFEQSMPGFCCRVKTLFEKGKNALILKSKISLIMISAKRTREDVILESIPTNINDGKILHLLYNTDINWEHVNAVKTFTAFNDDMISDWLNISVKTFREYKKPEATFKENVKEQVLLLLSLFKHGDDVFGSVNDFSIWLNQENFYFDNKAPLSFLNTVTGIKFIDDRLTAMEYGDNV